MSLREKTSYYIERQRHNIVSSNEMTRTIFEYIENRIDEHLEELIKSYIRETVPTMAEIRRSGIIDGVKSIKEILK